MLPSSKPSRNPEHSLFSENRDSEMTVSVLSPWTPSLVGGFFSKANNDDKNCLLPTHVVLGEQRKRERCLSLNVLIYQWHSSECPHNVSYSFLNILTYHLVFENIFTSISILIFSNNLPPISDIYL